VIKQLRWSDSALRLRRVHVLIGNLLLLHTLLKTLNHLVHHHVLAVNLRHGLTVLLGHRLAELLWQHGLSERLLGVNRLDELPLAKWVDVAWIVELVENDVYVEFV
jgi:hypothetical protein